MLWGQGSSDSEKGGVMSKQDLPRKRAAQVAAIRRYMASRATRYRIAVERKARAERKTNGR